MGEERFVISAGRVLVAPTLVPHRFEVLDRGLFESFNIQADDRFVTERLERIASVRVGQPGKTSTSVCEKSWPLNSSGAPRDLASA